MSAQPKLQALSNTRATLECALPVTAANAIPLYVLPIGGEKKRAGEAQGGGLADPLC